MKIDREGAKTSRSVISKSEVDRPDFEEVRLRKEILHLDKALRVKQRNEIKDTSLEIMVTRPASSQPVKPILK